MTDKAANDQYRARREATEARLREALERLVKGIPTNAELRRRRGYRLTVQTLAMEAAVSRNAIYTNHRGMLEALEAAKREDKIAELRAIIRGQVREIRQLATENATLLLRALITEEQLTPYTRKHEG